ncbi:MAG: bifunctional (p)ppGpp synthetase/guanosine-3',5'-bis(diphosphate) 3'-pyrophosphohydrolase [bacterium]
MDEILEKVQAYQPNVNGDLIIRAFDFGMMMHEGQKRKSGEPYMSHPVEVMDIIAELRLDSSSLAAGLLHDVVEDTQTTVDEVRDLFGEDVAFLVDGVTKLSKLSFNTREEAQAQNFRKMVIAMSRDLRVIVLKLADRLHNMRTMKHMPAHKAELISQETLDIYAPIAHRLGISWIKTELEDLSFRYLLPESYFDISEQVSKKKRERESFIREVIKILQELMQENEMDVEVNGRPKNFWSIYRKMQKQQIEFEHVFDVLAFRVIVDQKYQCYEALGLVHNLWKPIPGRFKDYIAIPKPNGYQSLHTSVIGPQQERIEIQIRTREMHKVAEEGIAAHWLYKEGKAVPDQDDQAFAWLHQLMEEHHDADDPHEFLESVKIDLFHDEVYVFTPRGDVKGMPSGATCLDFAYAIHTEVGHHCVGAKVNGQIVPLRHELNTGDICEIMTNPNQKPNKDWLSFVGTGRARTKIRNAVREEQRERSRELGREVLDRELKRYGTNIREAERNGKLLDATVKSKFHNIDEMLADVGYGKTAPETVLSKMFPQEPPEKKESRIGQIINRFTGRGKGKGVIIDGIEDIMVTYAKCCNPVPGDDVVGFITRGRGLSVHRRDCDKISHLEKERTLPVSWATRGGAEKDNSRHAVNVRVFCTDKPGLLANISQSFSDSGVNIAQAHCLTTEDQRAVNTFEVMVQDLDQLQNAMKKIRRIKGVYRVERA